MGVIGAFYGLISFNGYAVCANLGGMNRERDRRALEAQLKFCRTLAGAYPDGPTADNLQKLESEIRRQLDTLADEGPTDQAKGAAQEYADSQREIIGELRKKLN
ncbi:hypothetical protein V5279_32925 [Bradyrhizobium sp. 26S5]|uniref:hypothetical protein n=1 Tax=Bradyrhizobium sp. 26S5 TaxID=3139729 RepID=UPI0030D50F28